LEAALDQRGPGVRAGVVALYLWLEAHMGKSDFGLATGADDVEGDRGAGPFGPILEEAEVGVQDIPGYASAWHKFGDLLPRIVQVLVAIGEHIAECGRISVEGA